MLRIKQIICEDMDTCKDVTILCVPGRVDAHVDDIVVVYGNKVNYQPTLSSYEAHLKWLYKVCNQELPAKDKDDYAGYAYHSDDPLRHLLDAIATMSA